MIIMNGMDNKIKVSKTEESKSFWINQDFISQDLKNELEQSNILFLPEFWKNDDAIGFHSNVYPFYEFLEEKARDNLNINFCIEEKDYRELHLHNDVLWLGMILIEHFFLPLFINLFSDYIYDYFHDGDDEIDIKLNIQKEDENVLFEYHGNLDNLIKIMNDDNFNKLIGNSEE